MGMWFPIVTYTAVVALGAPLPGSEWPWRDICSYRHQNSIECDASGRADLPIFQENVTYEVLVLQHPINGDGSAVWKVADHLLGLTHSAIALRQVGGPAEIYIEYFALNFGAETLIPSTLNHTLTWSDFAAVGWNAKINHTEFPNTYSLGYIAGSVANKLMDWIPDWISTHRHYEMFSAWSKPTLNLGIQRHFDDVTCHTFVENAIIELVRLGAVLGSEEVLCRNYVVFVTAIPPRQVAENAARVIEMYGYYQSLANLVSGSLFHPRAPGFVWKVLEIVATTVAERKRPVAFLHDGANAANYHVELTAPYVGLNSYHVSQRMILPWQTVNSAKLGECSVWSASFDRDSEPPVLV